MFVNHLLCNYVFAFDNWTTTPSIAPGSTLTSSGSTNVKGAWTQVAANTDMTDDGRWIHLVLHSSAFNGTQRDFLVDVGIDPAGGTSYTTVIPNIVAGELGGNAQTGAHFLFPLFIPKGSSVALRCQSQTASLTMKAAIRISGGASNPEIIPASLYGECIGANTANSQGVSFTPGNGAWGSYASLGTTAQDCFWAQLAVQISNSVISTESTFVELAVGNGTNFSTLIREIFTTSTAEQCNPVNKSNLAFPQGAQPVIPAGSTLYVRGWCSAAPTTGYNAVALLMG